MDTLRKENMMQNNTEMKANRTDAIMDLRRRIYLLELMNLHKKVPQNDPEMADKVIREIKRFVDQEEIK